MADAQPAPAVPAAVARYYPLLDPLRGFAAFSVLVYHLVALAALPLPRAWPLEWFRVGFLGVDLFFAISGAVIVVSLAALRQRYGDGWRGPFALRRLARIVPLYLLTGAVFVLLVRPEVLARADAGLQVLAHLLFVHNLTAQTHGVINGPSWTLGVEMQFYLLAMLLAPWLLTARPWRIAAAALALGCAWRLGVWALLVRGVEAPESHRVFIYATQLPGVIEVFAAGVLAARWQLARQAAGSGAGAASAALLGLGGLLAWGLAIATLYWLAPVFWTDPASLLGFRPLLAVAAGLLVAALMGAPVRRAGPLLRGSGDLSYGIYLWHMPVLLLVLAWMPHAGPWAHAAVVVAGTLAVAALAWRWWERPFVRRARRTGVSASSPVSVSSG